MFLGLVHQLLEALGELPLNIFDFLLVVPMKSLLLQEQRIPLQNELFEPVEHILLDEPQIAGQLLVMDIPLNLSVKTYTLCYQKKYKVFIVAHFLCELKSQSFFLKIAPNAFAFVQNLVVCPVNIDLSVYIDLLLFPSWFPFLRLGLSFGMTH